MKSLYLTGDINDDMAQEAIKFFNGLGEHDKATVYISSSGGQVHNAEIIVTQIQMHSKRTQVIFANWIYSAAFLMFWRLAKDSNTKIIGPILGMVHYPYLTVEINACGKPDDNHEAARAKWITSHKARVDQMGHECGFTSSEMKTLQKGGDVWLYSDRMEQILKKLRESNNQKPANQENDK